MDARDFVPMTEDEALVTDQLLLAPADRLGSLIGWRWPTYTQALDIACRVREVAAVCGGIAAVFHGAANAVPKQLDLVYPSLARLSEALLDAQVTPVGSESVRGSDDRRFVFSLNDFRITARQIPPTASFDGDTELIPLGDDHARVLTSESLLRLSTDSPWPGEGPYLHSLRVAIDVAARITAA